ncbi:S41 family peptidase [Blastomonas sp.]|uniref:S41 family peptidase n=1 Tax=Blastomonas sp. TaxID=1909299 RepID=UPI003592EA66
MTYARFLFGVAVLPLCIGASSLIAQPASQAGEPATEAEPAPVEQPRTLANALASTLEAQFVYPDIGKSYADTLRKNADAGQYDGLTNRVALAERLTSDLLAIYPDRHLRVLDRAPDPSTRRAPTPGAKPVGPVEHAGWIAPGVAFVRFNLFPGEAETVAAAAKFMADHSDAKAIIFDLRTHRGGGVAEMDEIFPWLFNEETRLVTMATRRSVAETKGAPMSNSASMRAVDADPGFVTFEHWVKPGANKALYKAKVFVLSAPRTASAAEHFLLAMKHTGRGTIIGSPSAGANHFGGIQSIGEGFTAFVPVGRTYDPATGKDWETNGVEPDVVVAPEAALVEALVLAGVDRKDAERLSANVAPSLPMVPVRKPA